MAPEPARIAGRESVEGQRRMGGRSTWSGGREGVATALRQGRRAASCERRAKTTAPNSGAGAAAAAWHITTCLHGVWEPSSECAGDGWLSPLAPDAAASCNIISQFGGHGSQPAPAATAGDPAITSMIDAMRASR